MRHYSNIATTFNYRLSLCIQTNSNILTIPHPQLLGRDYHLTIFTISHKYRACIRSHDNDTVFTIEHLGITMDVMNVNVWLFAFFYSELRTIQYSWLPFHKLEFLFLNNQIGSVHFFLLRNSGYSFCRRRSSILRCLLDSSYRFFYRYILLLWRMCSSFCLCRWLWIRTYTAHIISNL